MWVVLRGREAPAAVGLVGGCASSGIVALENSLSQNEESVSRPVPVSASILPSTADFDLGKIENSAAEN